MSASTQDLTSNPAPTFHFKRRKNTHQKRLRADDTTDNATATAPLSTTTAAASDLQLPPRNPQQEDVEESDSTRNLKEILRKRKRPGARRVERARGTGAAGAGDADEVVDTQSADVEVAPVDRYVGRFVSQTGQVVDKDDRQMTEYVEARLAEQNHRKYGWPVPRHLQATVATIAPDLRHTLTDMDTAAVARQRDDETPREEVAGREDRLAVGKGMLEEVDLGPGAATWTAQQGGSGEPATGKVRLGRDGKPARRQPKRRNSEDVRRDQLVEAVLRESKLEYFDETPLANPRFAGTEDDMIEQFRTEYFESIESRRRPPRAPPVSSSLDKAKKDGHAKGPKLGGSRSARAAMHNRLREEQAAKTKQ